MYKVGDIIKFIGNKHYASAQGEGEKSCNPGIAKINMISEGSHPYAIVAEDYGNPKSDVFGYVSADDVTDLDANDVIDRLAYLEIINSPSYWKRIVNEKLVPNLDLLLIKSSKVILKKKDRAATPQEGIENLISAGVLNTPDYWTELIKYTNITSLLCALGGAVEKKTVNGNNMRDKFIQTAQSYLGYNEWDGSHREIIDIYNSVKPWPRSFKMTYSASWCATFVSAMAILCNIHDTIIPRECSCEHQINLFKKLGTWEEDESKEIAPGCIVYYVWDDGTDYAYTNETRWSDHVGICIAVGQEGFNDGMNLRSDEALIIEGNKNDQVGYRVIKKANAKYVRGFAKPNYSLV